MAGQIGCDRRPESRKNLPSGRSRRERSGGGDTEGQGRATGQEGPGGRWEAPASSEPSVRSAQL